MIQAGQQYSSVVANWDTTSVTVPVSFFNIGYTHFTQYNTPYNSQCSTPTQPASIIFAMDSQYCYYKFVTLGSVFARAVSLNGTGVWDSGGINTVLKSYNAGASSVRPVYDGYNSGNTFFSVDSGGSPIKVVTGAANKTLSDGTGVGSSTNAGNPQPGSIAVDPCATNAAARTLLRTCRAAVARSSHTSQHSTT